MTDIVKVAIITGIFTSLPTVLAQIINFLKLHKVSKEINGMKDALIQTTKEAAFEAGKRDQKENGD